MIFSLTFSIRFILYLFMAFIKTSFHTFNKVACTITLGYHFYLPTKFQNIFHKIWYSHYAAFEITSHHTRKYDLTKMCTTKKKSSAIKRKSVKKQLLISCVWAPIYFERKTTSISGSDETKKENNVLYMCCIYFPYYSLVLSLFLSLSFLACSSLSIRYLPSSYQTCIVQNKIWYTYSRSYKHTSAGFARMRKSLYSKYNVWK